MSNKVIFNLDELFISVGIDVGADFSWMSIALPNQQFVGKPYKILHNSIDSLTTAVSKIKEAEELYSLESRIFLESTGIYHYPLFCYLRDKGFNCSVINPIITKNSTNKYDEEINSILESLHELVDANEDSDFVKQIHLIETFKGAGFLSAVSIMGEIGDFSAFSKPKQLFAYFGLDPAVKQSGKFEGTKVQMSKRGSAIARRVIHTLTLQSISISRNREAKNPVLREYYLKKCDSKPKLVAMGAVSHKVCNMIFAILRDNKPFKIIAPQEHIKQYNSAKCDIAA